MGEECAIYLMWLKISKTHTPWGLQRGFAVYASQGRTESICTCSKRTNQQLKGKMGSGSKMAQHAARLGDMHQPHFAYSSFKDAGCWLLQGALPCFFFFYTSLGISMRGHSWPCQSSTTPCYPIPLPSSSSSSSSSSPASPNKSVLCARVLIYHLVKQTLYHLLLANAEKTPRSFSSHTHAHKKTKQPDKTGIQGLGLALIQVEPGETTRPQAGRRQAGRRRAKINLWSKSQG